jgi:tetratricopeptide (TPR) repeat protein
VRAVATGENESWDLDIWRDPAFRKSFLGSYGINAEIEPRVTTIEREQMEKVLELMDKSMGSALKFLLRSTKPASSAVFDFTIANIYFQRDDLDKAREWYERAIEKHKPFQRAYKNLGLVHVRSKRYREAIEPLTQAIELGARDGLTFGSLAFTYLMYGRYASAETAYRQAIMLQPESIDWKLGLARCLFKQQKYGEVVGLCSEMISRDPAKPDFWLHQANAFLRLKQPLKAAQNYEYLAAMGKASWQTLNMLGDVYANEGALDLAADAYLRAMNRAPDENVRTFIRDSEVLAARAAYSEATLMLEKITKKFEGQLTDEHRKRILKLEARLAAATGDPDKKQAGLLEEIVRLDPLDGEALILLGQLYARSDKIEKAIFQFERAASLEKYEAEARLRHGQCLVKSGRYQAALPLLKRAQELRPRGDVAKYIEQVERVARTQ